MTDTATPELVRFLPRAELERRQAQGAPSRPRAEVASGTIAIAILRIYDVIDSWGGMWGLSAAEVAAALDELPAGTPVEVHLNSPGGEATEGIAIANLLRQYPAKVTAIVDGLCASAASMVAMGANEVVMAPSSQMMIHEAAWGAYGDAAFLEQAARSLHHLSDRYAEAYAGKAGGDPATWRDLMRAETWYSPAEAVMAGLADRTLDEPATDEPAAAAARHDVRAYGYAGRNQTLAPSAQGTQTPAAASAEGSPTPPEGAGMTPEQLREGLGLPADASQTEVAAALAAAGHIPTAEATPPAATTETAVPPAATTVTPPAGTVLVDEQVFATLQSQAADGAAARAQQETERRERLVAEAVTDGRIAPAQRDAWLGKLAAEGETGEAVLASLQKGLVPLAALGIDGGLERRDGEGLSDDDLDTLAVMAGLPKGALRG